MEIKQIVDGLNLLSDINLQEKQWLKVSDSEVPGFVELVCQIFDDSGLQDAIDDNALSKYFPSDVVEQINRFDLAVKMIPTKSSAQALIYGKEMALLRFEASRLSSLLTSLLHPE